MGIHYTSRYTEASHTTACGGASPEAMGGLMYTVYVLKSDIDERYYIGYSNNVEQRLHKHNTGGTKSTRPYRPWKIVYTETFLEKRAAWLRERQIKSYKSGEAFRKLVRGGVA